MELAPHKDRDKLWPGWELNPRIGFDHWLSYKVRRELVVGIEDVKLTAMNIYKYKEGFLKVMGSQESQLAGGNQLAIYKSW